MDRFCLQILNFGNWEDEKTFTNLKIATDFATETFPHNEWKIYDIDNGSVVAEHDPMAVIENEARQDTRRFDNTVRYINNRNTVIAAAERQRQIDRERAQSRSNRLRGFNFVGGTPPAARFEEDFDIDDWTMPANKKGFAAYKIDWRKEGF